MKEESRIYNSSKNIFFGIANQLFTLVVSFISRKIFINILGAEYLGINGLFSNILTILSLAELGIGSSIIYSMYKPLAEGNKEKISQLMNFYKKIYRIIAIVVLLLGLLMLPFLKYLVNTTQDIPNLKIYFILFLLNSSISYLFADKVAIINADQKMYVTKIYSAVISLIQAILQILVLYISKNYILYLVIQIICTLLNNICGAVVSNRLYPYIKNSKSQLEKKEKEEIFINIKSMLIYKIGGVILNNTDNILISIFVGTIWVGYYSNYSLITGAIVTFTTIIFTALSASVGNLNSSQGKEQQYKIFKVLNLIVNWMFSYITIGIMLLISDVVQVLFGTEYVMTFPIVIAIAINFYLCGILNPVVIYRETTGMFRRTKYIIIITAIINIILSIILGRCFGVFGILIATAIARILTNIWYEPKVLYEEYFNKKMIDYLKPQTKNLIITVVAYGICTLLCRSIQMQSKMLLITFKVIICTVIVNGLFYVANKNSEEWKYILENIILKLKGSRNKVKINGKY